jgi:hypothetical protein
MNEVKDAMMSAHGRSFFLYSNGIENVDVIENTLGVLHNITKNLENIRKHPKKGGKPDL